MKLNRTIPSIFLIMLLILTSCVKEELNEIVIKPEVDNIEELDIPNNFDFSTHKELDISISDTASFARYSIQLEGENLFTGFIVDNKLEAAIRVATTTEELTLLRSFDFAEETFTVSISESTLVFDHTEN